MTAISCGKFWSGFAAGALSSIASSLYSGGQSMDGLGKNANAIAGTGFNSIGDNLGTARIIAFGTIAGGAGAALTGGNFWQGAFTGLVVSKVLDLKNLKAKVRVQLLCSAKYILKLMVLITLRKILDIFLYYTFRQISKK